MKTIEEKTIEIKNFDLSYDGMYFVDHEAESYRVYLPLDIIFKMIKIEGLSTDDIISAAEAHAPIHFDKVKMTIREQLLESGQKTYPIMSFSQYYLPEYFLILIGLDAD